MVLSENTYFLLSCLAHSGNELMSEIIWALNSSVQMITPTSCLWCAPLVLRETDGKPVVREAALCDL